MRYRPYTVYNVLGAVVWIWSMLFIGYFLGRYMPGVDKHIETVILVVIFLSLLPGLISWQRERRAHQPRDRASPSAEPTRRPTMAHTLPPLPYATDALEPHIDAQTMEIHHGKHHNAYVTNLNAALEKAPELADKSLDDLLRDLNERARGDPHRGAQQWRRTLEPLAVLAVDGPERGRRADRQAGRRDQQRVRRLREVQGAVRTPRASAASARAGCG